MSQSSALRAIQTTFYSTLHGDATLLALADVVNDAPEDQAYPYCLIGNATEEPWNTMGGGGFGWNATVTVHIYSRYQGDDEALAILNRVTTLLHHATLTVTGYSTVLCEHDETRVLVEYPAKVEQRHIVARFRVRVHP